MHRRYLWMEVDIKSVVRKMKQGKIWQEESGENLQTLQHFWEILAMICNQPALWLEPTTERSIYAFGSEPRSEKEVLRRSAHLKWQLANDMEPKLLISSTTQEYRTMLTTVLDCMQCRVLHKTRWKCNHLYQKGLKRKYSSTVQMQRKRRAKISVKTRPIRPIDEATNAYLNRPLGPG